MSYIHYRLDIGTVKFGSLFMSRIVKLAAFLVFTAYAVLVPYPFSL